MKGDIKELKGDIGWINRTLAKNITDIQNLKDLKNTGRQIYEK